MRNLKQIFLIWTVSKEILIFSVTQYYKQNKYFIQQNIITSLVIKTLLVEVQFKSKHLAQITDALPPSCKLTSVFFEIGVMLLIRWNLIFQPRQFCMVWFSTQEIIHKLQ